MLTNKQTPDYNPGQGDIINYPAPGSEGAKLGYETTDVNVGGVIVFLGGLFGFVLIFFVFCFVMGRVINEEFKKEDGPANKWHQQASIPTAGGTPLPKSARREDLKSNAAMEQQELQQMTTQFPQPRLDMDDGNQSTADLHAREDLLLEHYSSVPGQTAIRIPIERAMELVAEKGLPVAPPAQSGDKLAYDEVPPVTAPLTSGFARTGYELDTIEARQQKLDFGKRRSVEPRRVAPRQISRAAV